jgi:hypothetical protein
MTTVEAVVQVVASHGLGPLPTTALEIRPELLPAVLARVDAERLIGLFDQALADGALVADDDTAQAVGEAAVRAHAWSLLVERHHLEVHRVLDAAGIEHRFLKGPTVAHRFYEHPGLRPFRDVDVLVHSADLDRAAEVLRADGHERPIPQLVPGFDHRYGKSVDLRTGSGIEVDIHRTLAPGPFGVASLDPLWARPAVTVTVGGARLPALDATAAFVHACVHAVTGARTVTSSLRDVAATAPAEAEVSDLDALAASLGATACVAAACARTAKALHHVPDAVCAMATWPIPARQRAWLDLYDERPGYRRMAWATLGAMPGLARKARYLVVLARAQRAHRRAHQLGVAPGRPT